MNDDKGIYQKPEINLAKPGREAYTILDKGFFYGLRTVGKIFDNDEINYALYGGTGLQVHFARQTAGDKSIEEAGLKYLRPTGDFDIAIPPTMGNGQLTATLSKLEQVEEEFDNEIYTTSLMRNGSRRQIMLVNRTANEGNQQTIIWLTLANDNDYLTDMRKERQKINLRYNPTEAEIYVSPIEYIVAGKLARLSLFRDIPDLVVALNTFEDIDMEKVRATLKRMERKHQYISRTLPFIRDRETTLHFLDRHHEKNDTEEHK